MDNLWYRCSVVQFLPQGMVSYTIDYPQLKGRLGLETQAKCYCYIANAKAKRNWLIRGHVALDKCNVSPRETSKKLLPGYEYRKNKMAA